MSNVIRAAATLQAVSGHIPASLVSASAHQRVAALAARLPAALIEGFYLECRLAAATPAVDYIVRVSPAGRRILAGHNPRIGAGPDDPRWRAVRRLAHASLAGPLCGFIDSLWLEFDAPSKGGAAGREPLRPSVFVGLDPASVRGLSLDDWTDLVLKLLRYAGLQRTPDADNLLHRTLRMLPPGVSVPYVGVLLGRPGQPVRLYFSGFRTRAVRPWLARAGLCGSAGPLVDVVDRIGADHPISMFHIDMNTRILRRWGLEYTLERLPQLRGRLVEEALLDRLVREGFCTERKRDALLAWPGCEIRTMPHQLWPSLLHRRVNCIKLAIDQAAATRAKAYLWTGWPDLTLLKGRRVSPTSIR
jgi:hypothetical protein